MEWSFTLSEGAVTVRQEGRCAICQAICRTDEPSLYKAWLIGTNGHALLGTLIPDGGALRLHRSVEIAWLERQGAWPPKNAEIIASFRSVPQRPPKGWCRQEEPWKLLEKGDIQTFARKLAWGYLTRDTFGFRLAFPWEQQNAFPLLPLFCFSQIKRLEGTVYIIFRFTKQGTPQLPNVEDSM